ncbi:MAG TPA: hypothetical protein VF120_01285, partial [Ktedonobacterales bacterium]
MSTIQSPDGAASGNVTPRPWADPLPSLQGRLAEVEALENAPTAGEALSERRRARVEAETHRISEEVTRCAQERRWAQREAAQRRQAQLREAPATPIMPVNPDGSAPPSPCPIDEDQAQEPTMLYFAAARLPASLTFKRILVPLDGSALAERAIPIAARIAA